MNFLFTDCQEEEEEEKPQTAVDWKSQGLNQMQNRAEPHCMAKPVCRAQNGRPKVVLQPPPLGWGTLSSRFSTVHIGTLIPEQTTALGFQVSAKVSFVSLFLVRCSREIWAKREKVWHAEPPLPA